MSVYSSTLTTIRANVMNKVRLDTTDDVTKVDEWINQAYADLVQETGALQKVGTASLTAGSSSYALPSQVAHIKQLVIVYPDSSRSKPLQRINLGRMLNLRRQNLTQPIARPVYAISGQNQVEVWPEPTSGSSLEFWYVYLPEKLVATTNESHVLFEPYGSKALEAGACVEAAIFKKDPLLELYKQDYRYWVDRYMTFLNRRMGSSSLPFEVAAYPESYDEDLILLSEKEW